MKQIIGNTYIKAFKFAASDEASTFADNQKAKNYLSVDDVLGESYYCYVGYHSLTREKQFVFSFSSDENEDNLNFLFWNDLFILDTAKNIYLIDESLRIKAALEITTPLVGLYLVNRDKLLVLEEAYMRVINYEGEIVKAELFDLMEDFSIQDNLLSIQTGEKNIVIELT